MTALPGPGCPALPLASPGLSGALCAAVTVPDALQDPAGFPEGVAAISNGLEDLSDASSAVPGQNRAGCVVSKSGPCCFLSCSGGFAEHPVGRVGFLLGGVGPR